MKNYTTYLHPNYVVSKYNEEEEGGGEGDRGGGMVGCEVCNGQGGSCGGWGQPLIIQAIAGGQAAVGGGCERTNFSRA